MTAMGAATLTHPRYDDWHTLSSSRLHDMLLLPVPVPFESLHVPISKECDLKWVRFDGWRRKAWKGGMVKSFASL